MWYFILLLDGSWRTGFIFLCIKYYFPPSLRTRCYINFFGCWWGGREGGGYLFSLSFWVFIVRSITNFSVIIIFCLINHWITSKTRHIFFMHVQSPVRKNPPIKILLLLFQLIIYSYFFPPHTPFPSKKKLLSSLVWLHVDCQLLPAGDGENERHHEDCRCPRVAGS